MDDEPERMDPRCDAGGRGYMLWMEYCSDGEYIRATDYDALAAKLAEWQAAQHYTYIGKDGKQVLARDLEARADAAKAALSAMYRLALGDAVNTLRTKRTHMYTTRYDEFVQTRTRGVDEMADMIEASPTPTAAELMARIQTGEEE